MIRYAKVFLLQVEIVRKSSLDDEDGDDDGFLLDAAADEVRRAVRFKAAETYLEAAPQLMLQVYITYNRTTLLEGIAS